MVQTGHGAGPFRQLDRHLRQPGLTACLLLGLVLAVAGFPRAGAAGTIYMYKDPRGVMHFTDLPRSEDYTPYCTWPDSNQVDRGRILSLIRTYSRQYGIDPGLVQAVVRVESNFSPTARSKAGAEGLMQLMPQTQQDMGVNRPMDIEDNIQGGVRYLHHLLDRFSSLELALAAYNAGPARVEAHGGVPPFPETQRYVRKVLSVYQDYSAKTREYVQSGQ